MRKRLDPNCPLDSFSALVRFKELDALLMDVEMPIQDGLTCTREIRRLEAEGIVGGGEGGRRVPIIAVSANARAEQIREARAAGCDDVLVKPYRMPELIEKMQLVARRVWAENREKQAEREKLRAEEKLDTQG